MISCVLFFFFSLFMFFYFYFWLLVYILYTHGDLGECGRPKEWRTKGDQILEIHFFLSFNPIFVYMVIFVNWLLSIGYDCFTFSVQYGRFSYLGINSHPVIHLSHTVFVFVLSCTVSYCLRTSIRTSYSVFDVVLYSTSY